MEESHRQHEHVVKALKTNTSISEEGPVDESPEDRLQRLQAELHRVQEESAQQLTAAAAHTESLAERLHELELATHASQGEQQLRQRELLEQLSELETQRSALAERVRYLEAARQQSQGEADARFAAAVRRFESELEAGAVAAQEELRDAQLRSEEALAQLRECYEREKEKLEGRIAEERDRNTRRMANAQEELEGRMLQEAAEREEEIECLQGELREAEQRHQAYVAQVDHELGLKH